MTQITSNIRIKIRPANEYDQQRLATLMHFEHYVHRHLDWVSPLDKIDEQPFLVVEQEGQIQAALACPVDPPHIAWIRLFTASGTVSYEAMWQLLWREAREYLSQFRNVHIAAIALHNWLNDMLERSKFKRIQEVVFLTWQKYDSVPLEMQTQFKIRPMVRADLAAVRDVDEASFGAIWQNSLISLTAAYDQSYISTVVEDQEEIVGYQISTAGQMGGHLARLAVHPRWQGRKIGRDLLVDVLRKFKEKNIHRVTVNTQQDNFRSLKLYQKMGFVQTGESYGVYEYVLEGR